MSADKDALSIFDIVIAVLSIVLSAVLSVGGYLFFTDNDTWKEIFSDVSIILYILPFCLLGIAVINLFFKNVFTKAGSYIFIFLLSIIGILSSYSTLLILENRDLLIDSDAYIATRVAEEIQKQPTQSICTSAPVITQSSFASQTNTPNPELVENAIIEFVNLVNSKIILGLSNSKKNEEDIYSYTCKTTPSAREQMEVFYRSLMRKYCGYGNLSFSLPAKYQSMAIVQEPLEIDDGEYIFSQIEHWEYTVYSGEKNERIDVSEKLYEYIILEIEGGLYCISNYEYKDPPENYYLGLEKE